MFESVIREVVRNNIGTIRDFIMEALAECLKDYVENRIADFDYSEIVNDYIDENGSYSLDDIVDTAIKELCEEILEDM